MNVTQKRHVELTTYKTTVSSAREKVSQNGHGAF